MTNYFLLKSRTFPPKGGRMVSLLAKPDLLLISAPSGRIGVSNHLIT